MVMPCRVSREAIVGLELMYKNVLFLMADEHLATALSCLGHPIVQTPNLDRLAARGTCFINAYTPSPICVPARASVATGRYVHQQNYWDNAHAYDGRFSGWGQVLQGAGISTTSIGKLHYRREEDATGFDHQILPMHIFKGIGQVWGSVRNPLPRSREGGGMLGDIGAGISKYNQYDIKVADAAATWLQDPRRADTRWLAFVSFVAPHFPLTVPQEYLDLYPVDAMPLPEIRLANGYAQHPWVARMNSIEDSDSELETDSQRRAAIAAYYALCTFVDAQIGKVLEALEATGQLDDTLIIYTSDHGEQLGKRGRWGKSLLYRESTQVPLILAGGAVPENHRVQTAVNLIDIAPTITDAFGLSADDAWPGQSLLRIAAEPDDPERLSFAEYHAANSPSGGFMIANARWKYHEYVGYPSELFDLAEDPEETCNLTNDPAYSEQLNLMRAALHDICDPIEIDARAKADQDKLVARFGGPEQAFKAGPSGATPAPT